MLLDSDDKRLADFVAACPGHVVLGSKMTDRETKRANKAFSANLESDEIIALVDTSPLRNGATGILISEAKMYSVRMPFRPQKIWYDEIESIATETRRDGTSTGAVILKMKDRKDIHLPRVAHAEKELSSLIQLLVDMETETRETVFEVDAPADDELYGFGGGYGIANRQIVNRVFEEEKFHARQGHGYAAERAENLHDRLRLKNAKVLGDSYVKNGPDRVIVGRDGASVFIQSKYCATGQQCVSSCFEDGCYRYLDSTGKPMLLEVPSDNYDDAVRAMRRRIESGQVPGVTDPDEAKAIVKKGSYTYQQARNIAKAGNVDSLVYDAKNGAVTSLSAFGVSATISFAVSIWSGDDLDVALRKAASSGLKVGGASFVVSLLASQLSKAGLNSALVASSEAIVNAMGPRASAVLINAFRSGGNIYGAAAMKSAAKLLRSNAITAVLTVAILSAFDVADIFRGRISGPQLFKNVMGTTVGVVGGVGGWMGGAAVGSLVMPGVGTIAGGLLGSIAAGGIAGKATNSLVGHFVEDDASKMVAILQKELQQVAEDYLLNKKEVEKTVDDLSEKLDGRFVKDMFASEDQPAFARGILEPMAEGRTAARRSLPAPRDEMIAWQIGLMLKNAAEDADEEGGEPS